MSIVGVTEDGRVISHTGFEKCRQCGRYRPKVKNGRCAECRGGQKSPETAQKEPVESSTTTHTNESLTDLQKAAHSAIEEHGGLRAAGRALGCNHGIIGLAADGHDFPAAREALGLPPKTVTVEPCPDCGEVHEQLHTCPDELERQRQGPKRHRRCYEGGRGESGQRRVERLDAWLARNGWESLTEAVDEIMEVEQ